MESDHGLEKILGVGLELEFKSIEPDWIRTPKKVTPLISATYHTDNHQTLYDCSSLARNGILFRCVLCNQGLAY